MPEFDYAMLCDYVRSEGGMAHVIGAGIDTVNAAEVPTGRNVGLLVRLTFTRNECGRPHRVEVIFQDTDGETLLHVGGSVNPEWKEGLPAGWKTGAQLAFILGLPLPRYGEYSIEVMVNDQSAKSINLRVVPRPTKSAEMA